MHRQIDQDREDQERDEAGHRPIAQGMNALPKRFDHPGAAAHVSAAIHQAPFIPTANDADAGGQGPIIAMCHQKWKKLKSVDPGR